MHLTVVNLTIGVNVMKKVMSIAAIAFMMAGSTAFACGGCGCETKKTEKGDKEKTECSSSCKSEKKQTACGGSKKSDTENQTACSGGSQKHDKSKKAA
jgi:hypothetical protein